MKLYIRYLWIVVYLISCTQGGKNNSGMSSNDLVRSQLYSSLMFAQLESEGNSLYFHVAPSDSQDLYVAIKKLPKLVFFHSEINCNSCVEENIHFLNNFANSIGNENILYIASYKNKRDLTLFKRINNIESNIYNVLSIGLPIEELNVPFCFVMNRKNIAECVFIPLKEDSLYFKHYLEIVKSKYFQ